MRRAAARSPTAAWSSLTATELAVEDVYRIGDDQAIRVANGEREVTSGDPAAAAVDRRTRHATMRNHTATHLLHAALRERLGTHVRQAGSAVRPDKLRFDFTHGAPLGAQEVRAIEDRVNEWVKASFGVRALEMERTEAEALGAMALFGEKYGDWVRMVEVDEVSRELCGGTHVANTAEVGIIAIVSEGSSAANVRRIEALTGPEAIDHYRRRSDELAEAGGLLGLIARPAGAARAAPRRVSPSSRRRSPSSIARPRATRPPRSARPARRSAGSRSSAGRGEGDQQRLLDLADQIKQREGDAAVVLGGAGDGKVALVASFSPSAVEKGANAVEVIREAAAIVGGGGGGRPEVAQAGGRDADKLDEALETARQAIHRALT